MRDSVSDGQCSIAREKEKSKEQKNEIATGGAVPSAVSGGARTTSRSDSASIIPKTEGKGKKKTRSWFHDCGILNVPLNGTKFGLIRSIAF